MVIQRRLFVLHCVLSILGDKWKNLIMTKCTAVLCYRITLVKWKHHLTVDKQAERAFTWLIMNTWLRDSEAWNHEIWRLEIMRLEIMAMWLFKYLLFHRDLSTYSKRGSIFIPECSRHGTVMKSFLHKWSKRGIPQGDWTTAPVTVSKPTVPEWMEAGR